MKKKMTLMALVGVTVAFFGTVRSVPLLASTGWTMFFYMFVAAVLFALPVALMSAEMTTAFENDDSSGANHWISEALSHRWGFTASLLLWVQMFFGMAMVGSTVASLFGYVIQNTALGNTPILVFLITAGVFWVLTLLNLKFDMTKVSGGFGAIIGIYIPFVVLLVLGIMYLVKNGINPKDYLGDFTLGSLLPNKDGLALIPAIVFIFAGVEMSCVHVRDVDKPAKTFPLGMITAVLLVALLNLACAFTVADAVEEGTMEVSHIMKCIAALADNAGLPTWFDEVLAACILIGTLVTISAWITGPAKAMLLVAQDGNLPPVFQKTNKLGVPVTLVLVQAGFVSLIALLFVLLPNVDQVFLILNSSTMLLYCVVYLLICISAIVLRYKRPELDREFRIGKKGNQMMWAVAVLAGAVILFTVFSSFVPPANLAMPSVAYIILQVCILAFFLGLSFAIMKFKKDSWKVK